MSQQDERICLYPGTFDPITLGHFDVIERASRLFGKVVVAIGVNANKKTFFTTEERQEIVVEACSGIENIEIIVFSGLAVDCAKTVGASALVRGLRTEADFMYEMQMAMMNRTLMHDLETVFIPTRQDLSHVSSTLAREVSSLGGDISGLVPTSVSVKLSEKHSR